MRVLDLDMDYFLDHPVFGVPVTKKKRVDDPECINSVWSEERVRSFLENNLGLENYVENDLSGFFELIDSYYDR